MRTLQKCLFPPVHRGPSNGGERGPGPRYADGRILNSIIGPLYVRHVGSLVVSLEGDPTLNPSPLISISSSHEPFLRLHCLLACTRYCSKVLLQAFPQTGIILGGFWLASKIRQRLAA
jgi:hypothetical protein